MVYPVALERLLALPAKLDDDTQMGAPGCLKEDDQKPKKKANKMTHAKILIVEDDAPSAAHLEECLENLGYTVCAAVSCGHEAIEKAEHKCPDLALVNLGLDGEVSGLETAEQIGSRFDVPVVYLTDGAEEDLLQRAQATNPFGYVVKPFEERQLHLNIQTAVSMHERETRHRKTEMRLKRIIKKLKDFTRLMKTVFDSMSEGVVAVNENGELVFHNSVARGFGEGLPAEQDIDKWAEKYGVFQPDGKALVAKDESPLTLALNGKATDDFEVMVHNEEMPEGVHAHISISGRPLRGKAGALKGGVLVFRDITKSSIQKSNWSGRSPSRRTRPCSWRLFSAVSATACWLPTPRGNSHFSIPVPNRSPAACWI